MTKQSFSRQQVLTSRQLWWNLRDYKSDLHIDTQVLISGSDGKCNDKSEPEKIYIIPLAFKQGQKNLEK